MGERLTPTTAGVRVVAELARPNGSKGRIWERLRWSKEQLVQTLAVFVTSILTQPRGGLDVEEATEPPLRLIIEVLKQVTRTHDAEQLAISVLEFCESDGKKWHLLDL